MRIRGFHLVAITFAWSFAIPSPGIAAWVDDFDNGDPLTNSTSIGWQQEINQGPSPILAEPGRDGEGTLELANGSGAGKGTLVTTSHLTELNFFAGPTRVVFEDVSSWVYQSDSVTGENKTLGGGTSNMNTYLFISGYSAALDGLPRDGANTVDGFQLHFSNLGLLNISVWQNSLAAASTQSISGVPYNGTKYDVIVDLDPINYTVTVIDAATDVQIGQVPDAHNLSHEHYGGPSGFLPGSFLAMESSGNVAGGNPRYATLSIGKISAGIPEEIAGDYDSDGDVDGSDFLEWQRALGSVVEVPGEGADGDESGTVDAGDLTVWQDNFGGLPPGAVNSVAVPEPSAIWCACISLVVVVALDAAMRKRIRA